MTKWEDQVNLFRRAASMTPSGTIDHVVANAGIAIDDEVFSYNGTSSFFECISVQANAAANRSGVPTKTSQPEDDRSQPSRCSVHHQAGYALVHQTEWDQRHIVEPARHESHPHRLWGGVP